jgi:sugar lactone lactonase YvrE
MRNHVVRRVDAATRAISTVAGTGQAGFGGDGGPGTQATMRQPHSIQFGPDGSLYICDIGNHRIRKLQGDSGRITTFAGTGEKQRPRDGDPIHGVPLWGPRTLDVDAAGHLWLALREGNAVYRLDLSNGRITHAAGTGDKGFTGHGASALQATLSGPKGLSVGSDGHIYLADTESHSIRRINTSNGHLELVAGTGERGDGPNGDPLGCRMARPHGVFADSRGGLYIGDSEAHQVRYLRISP